MTALFEDFICRLIEAQSGARAGKDPSTSHTGFNRFVHARRIIKGEKEAKKVTNTEEQRKIRAKYRHYAMDVFKQNREKIIKKNMTLPKTKPERSFGLLDNG
jgi:hypothetical protein